jgi:hypothetical protein
VKRLLYRIPCLGPCLEAVHRAEAAAAAAAEASARPGGASSGPAGGHAPRLLKSGSPGAGEASTGGPGRLRPTA